MVRLDEEIRLCVEHIDITNSRYAIIGDFIAKCLLVRICSKYEIAICDMVQLKLENMTDDVFCNKMNQVLKRFSLLPSELEKKILERFGNECVRKFKDKVDSDTRREYSNMIENRHSVAHGRDITFTIDDIPKAHQCGKVVLCAFEEALEPYRVCDSHN